MSRLRDKVIVSIFLTFIFFMFILFFALPKSKVSVNEKRDLAAAPKLTVSKLLSGGFEEAAEDYLTDHFPFRDGFVSVNSYFALLSGRNGVNGVYKGRDGYLINTPAKNNNLNNNIQTINDFIAKVDMPISVMIVPQAGSILTDKLPKNHAPYIETSELPINNTIDLSEKFKELKDKTQLYYKTDHHWTSEGAYEAYKLIEANAYDKSQFSIESYGDFYGTTYSKSALWLEKGEEIELWTYPCDITVTINDGAEDITHTDMFFRKYLREPDKYPVYLDGNHAYTRIVNDDTPDGKVLIIKDSYGNSLAPFLALNYNTVDLIDLRYYSDIVSETAEKEQYDKILMVYGLSTVAETTDINMLE